MVETRFLPPTLQSQLLLQVPGVVHAFTTRQGGVSQGAFGSLNLSGRVDDDRAAVEVNRASALAALGRPDGILVMLKQVHGDEVVEVTRAASRSIEADAMLTRDRGAVLAVLAADCVPILMASRDGRVVAAVHAGWRGTQSKIAARAVGRLVDQGNEASKVVVALGPAIGPCCFAIGDDTAAALRNAFPKSRAIFPNAAGQVVADLWQLNTEALVEAGVLPEAIDVVRRCTACEHQHFYSHRRDEGKTGRQAGLVALR